MESLPLPLLHRILAYAVPGYVKDVAVDRRDNVMTTLEDLMVVAKAWVAPMREIVRQYRDSTLILHFRTATDQELQQMYRKTSERGTQITELIVSIGTFDRSSHHVDVPLVFWTAMENVVTSIVTTIDWSRIITPLTALKTLNLSAMYLNSRHLIDILEAAATSCLNLEKLVLPAQKQGLDEKAVQAALDKLYDAMKRWRTHGKCGGLRHLKVPVRNDPFKSDKDNFRISKEFFENVRTNCPEVEYLDGYKETFSTRNHLASSDVWFLDLEDWDRFNTTCTKLRKFDWVVAPFGDPYFRVFGEHVKPNLKTLTFGVNMRWNWQWYFHDKSQGAGELPDVDWEEESYCERPGYGFLATDPAAALTGCPMLDELIVRLYHVVELDVHIPPDMGDVFDYPEEEMVNQNVFDDRFCEVLATHCPFVSRFVIKEKCEYLNRNQLRPIETFTDRGLIALTRLKFLRSLELRSINCTGKGILAFLNAQSDEFTGNRSFEITVGGCPDSSKLAFYSIVKELLVQLANTPDLRCTHQKFALRLENWSYNSRYSVDLAWSATYLQELQKLMNRVKDVHPSLRQHVVTMNGTDTSFTRIAEFGLYTVHMDPSIYCEWEEWEQEEENEGITIVDREDLLDDEVCDEEDEDFNEEGMYGDYDDWEGES